MIETKNIKINPKFNCLNYTMSRIKLSEPLRKAVGKIFGGADWWLMERYGTQYTAHKNHPRDYKKNPQSKAEKACTLRLAAASKAYNELVKGSPEWLELEREYQAQFSKPGAKKSIRGYYISKHMKGGVE